VSDPMDQPQGDEMELVVPFVVCQSEGGPYDDQSFVAGFQAGRADEQMRIAAVVGARNLTFTVYSDLVRQIELSAMRYGFADMGGGALEGMPEWSWVTVNSDEAGTS